VVVKYLVDLHHHTNQIFFTPKKYPVCGYNVFGMYGNSKLVIIKQRSGRIFSAAFILNNKINGRKSY
jgi:hypothetical protein